jgi:hypothetical protein
MRGRKILSKRNEAELYTVATKPHTVEGIISTTAGSELLFVRSYVE